MSKNEVKYIYPNVIVGGAIEIFENAIENPEEIIFNVEKECQDSNSSIVWERAKVFGSDKVSDSRTNYNLSITNNAKNSKYFSKINDQITNILMSSSIPYADKHGVKNMYASNYNMLKYSSGQMYGSHYDGGSDTKRAISAICYLNNNFDGGEIEFVNFEITIKPQPGMLILFPSCYAYRHIAHPVFNGTKYAIVTWIHDD